jgi:hypothetical protein
LLFVDASHFIHAFHPDYALTEKRVFTETASGRKRYNVLGALNFATKAISATGNDSYMNAASAVDPFNKLLPEHPGSILNIALDNAKYQKCKAISEYIALYPSIKLFYPPLARLI